MMTEQERENLYWKLSLCFLAGAPVVLYFLGKIHLAPGIQQLFFSIAVFGSIPLALVFDLGLTKLSRIHAPVRFWIVKPTVTGSHFIHGMHYSQCLHPLYERLGKLGFY